ncbi:MAG: 3-dehydroquinate synthase [Clostridia bacterium]|nr:3-dehydroquinate synthase [Clostridia bacterium]
MRIINVNLKKNPYNIYVKEGLIKESVPILEPVVRSRRVAVVTDTNVAPLYLESVKNAVSDSGGNVFEIVLPSGEENKTLATVEKICTDAMLRSFTRNDVFIALGGGVIGDMTALAASLTARGAELIAVPTTLLAQVDSSIGGKTGVNLACGKNLIGTFYQPRAVIADTSMLSTLPLREWRCGMAEIIKYAAIKDETLTDEKDTEKMIARCAQIKSAIVAEDEFDRGERMLLNFGHTIGHAVENALGYGVLSHGEAVAIGMYAMCLYGEREKLTEIGTARKLRELCENEGLCCEADNLKDMLAAVGHDKKRDGDKLSLVLLRRFGKGFVKQINMSELSEVVQ